MKQRLRQFSKLLQFFVKIDSGDYYETYHEDSVCCSCMCPWGVLSGKQ